MKYRTQSAEVLNEADALERQLDWMLFTSEQEALLWGGEEGEWEPGIPLFPHPYNVTDDACDCPDCRSDMPEGYEGNTVRPMFQVFERDDTLDTQKTVRCQDCQTLWHGDEPCFVCYEKRVDPNPHFGAISRMFMSSNELRMAWGLDPIGQVNRVEENDEGLIVAGTLNTGAITIFEDYDIDRNEMRFLAEAEGPNGETLRARRQIDRNDLIDTQFDVSAWLRNEMTLMIEAELWASMNRAMQPVVVATQEAARHVHAWADGMMGHFSIAQPTVSVQAEETEACSDVDLSFDVERLYVESPPTTPPFTLPRNVDLSPTRPVQPPIIDVTDGRGVETRETRRPGNTPITEQRRTRGRASGVH